MKVVQILPELNAGGVERGTLEIAAHLVREGHESIVISNGGRMVEELERGGTRHVAMPVHRKSLASLLQVRSMRRFLLEERPDIVHIRSRVPGWVTWLAWRWMDPATRPRLVSTVHGFYSVNRYSAVMTRGERVIAVSDSVQDYIFKNYPKTAPAKVEVIHRGVDETVYPVDFVPSDDWQTVWANTYPAFKGRILLLMPGRLTRWKGQQDFIQLIARLIDLGLPVHGLIVGEPHPKKIAFLNELRGLTATLGITDRVSFLGHRNDLREIMAISSIIYSLSLAPEAFGRVSLEALALGKPVIAYEHGGVAEQLKAIFPKGLAKVGDLEAIIGLTREILATSHRPSSVGDFSLDKMTQSTFGVYSKLNELSRIEFEKKVPV
jgi:glycosyltransferase involved in cell wall biosynthesis